MAAVADDDVFDHLIDGARIDADAANRYLFATPRAVAVDLKRFAGLENEHVFQSRVAQMTSQRGVLGELAEFPVNGHKIARPQQIEHQLQLLGAAMTGDVHRWIHRAVDYICAALGEMVDHPVDALFVSGYDARAEHDRVAALDRKALVIV